EAAKRYYEDGFNVVAVKLSIASDGSVEKKPLVNWSAWINRRQTEEEFEAQPWSTADGFAIVCSWPNKDGLYLAVVDLDVKKVSADAKRRGEKLLDRFPITRIERTISNGLHYDYLSRVKPQPVSEAHDSCALELIAGPKLCIMAPSKGYKNLNDNPPRVVEDAEEMFREIVRLPNQKLLKIEKEPKEKLERWLNQNPRIIWFLYDLRNRREGVYD
ncbi:bifunctional DNA primase/polymerase, partial [Candidatus Bathyarchaeota archaeon]|nr:bifunctional DNA primase/polymerase [Candidatus Bathyarchaeota archaeon]